MLPEHITGIMDALSVAGFQAYAVGGCVRDTLLGRAPHDWDVATDALCADVMRIFARTAPTGESFGTVTVFYGGGAAEVTTFRTEGEYRDGRRPESVGFVRELERDLERRDFTMNALAMSRAGEITDLFGGAEDIKSGLIRCVGEPEKRFSEDALRMLRAVRFSAQLGFDIEERTMAAIKKLGRLSAALSPERVRDELIKTLLSPRPEAAAEMLALGLLSRYAEQKPAEENAMRRIASLPEDGYLRFSAFSAVLLRAGAISGAEKFMRALKLPSSAASAGGAGAAAAVSGFPEPRAGIKRLVCFSGESAALTSAWCALVLGDGTAVRRLESVLSSGECTGLSTLAVSGGDVMALGIPAGPETGRALALLLEHVLEHPEDNERGALIKILKERE